MITSPEVFAIGKPTGQSGKRDAYRCDYAMTFTAPEVLTVVVGLHTGPLG